MRQPVEGSDVVTRAGHIALVGRPNVGKSTLMNALVGEKLSIVTPRAQTTREPVMGILTAGSAQAIFVDTPGLLEPKYALQHAMLEAALAALADADVALLILDATRPDEVPEHALLDALRRVEKLFIATNKVDAAPPANVEELTGWAARELAGDVRRISATTGTGVEALREELVAALPRNPFFYPEDDIATQSVRFFVAELVRETIFEEYEQEVPYSTVVRIEEYREAEDPIYIRATVYVERESQKAILIGRGGQRIRRLGERAREKIEQFVGARVYLDLWVKPLAGWRKKPSALKYLGYPVPPGADARARRSGRAEGGGADPSAPRTRR